jgi:hypothetical protein
MGHLKAGAFGLASAVAAAIVAKVSAVCPDLLAQWPALLTAGLMAGVGVYLKSPMSQEENIKSPVSEEKK